MYRFPCPVFQRMPRISKDLKWFDSQRKGGPRRDNLLSENRATYPLGTIFFLWQSDHLSPGNLTTYPLEIGPLIRWESDHLSSGNRTNYSLEFGTSSGKRDTLSSVILTTYTLGNILWEPGIWESVFNHSCHAPPPAYRSDTKTHR